MDHGAYLKSVFGLEGKTAMITGAAGGIGAAISEGLAYAGAEVALCGRTLEKCQALADRINANGGKATAYHLDVSDMSEIVPRVEEIVARYGKIDVLFNVAGINKREGLLDVEEETYDRIMNTNLKGVYFVSQAVAREMYKRKSGSIINIGSHNDTAMLGGCSVYGAAKSGVIAITRSLAVECARYGIRCNAISPGHIITELTQVSWDSPNRAPYMRERIAMERGGQPEELVGKTLIAIVNLPPRKMMGLESNGMLISAVHTEHGEECLHLIMVDDSIPAGAKLC